MLKITLKENNFIRNVLVPESKTIRQVLVENHIDYSDKDVFINALPVQPHGLDTKFSHISDEATHYVITAMSSDSDDKGESSVMKMDIENSLFQTAHAPKVFLISSVCIIVSALTAQEIRKLKHARPDLLEMKDNNQEPYFAMDIESGYGSLKEYGAVYSDRVTCEGKATITILLSAAEQDLSDVIINKLGISFHKLVQLEKRILAEEHGIPLDDAALDYCLTQI